MEDDFNELTGMLSEEKILRPLTDEQVRYMANRFLGWRLPRDFHPDAGITYKPPMVGYGPSAYESSDRPTGTNLFDASQAEEMVRYMVDGLPR